MTDTTIQMEDSSTEGKRNFGQTGSCQPGLELKFEGLYLDIKGNKILHDVSGCAKPGQILAVMGPSGSGKTTLLNVIGGRIKSDNAKIMLDGQTLTKKIRRKISYVLQEDIFFPNLTLGDTLMFSAELRLSEKKTRKAKEEIVQEIVEQLDIDKCMKTIIGGPMLRGLSGGEKKRANIANELLTDPAVLLLDEPTSGLDSTTAYGLAHSLKRYALRTEKTIVMTVHQPSSQMFFLFDTVLLLAEGQIAYYGLPNNVLDHFSGIGFSCNIPHYNPADFILDMAKSEPNSLKQIFEEFRKCRSHSTECPLSSTRLSVVEVKHSMSLLNFNFPPGMHVMHFSVTFSVIFDLLVSWGYQSIGKESLWCCANVIYFILICLPAWDYYLSYAMTHDSKIAEDHTSLLNNRESRILPNGSVEKEAEKSKCSSNSDVSNEAKTWTTSFWKQFTVLTERSFLQGKSRYLSKLKFTRCIGVAIIVGVVWWQIGAGLPTESKIDDISAMLFFTATYNSFNPLFEVLIVFPSERTVINKERMAGSYRLSAYYLAKLASELPLVLILPSIFLIMTYWMTGLNGMNHPWPFFGTVFVILFQAVASQSIGIFVSASTMDFDHGMVLAILVMITFMLLGGLYVKNIPTWISWLKYSSPIMHSWVLLLYLEFDSDSRFICNPTASAYESCQPHLVNETSDNNVTNNNATHFIRHEEILDRNKVDISPWVSVVGLFAILVVFRLLGYFSLRLLHKPISK